MVWFNHAGIREVPSSWWRASADRQLWRSEQLPKTSLRPVGGLIDGARGRASPGFRTGWRDASWGRVIRIPDEGLGLDSCAVAKRVGWCAMSRGGRPWRGLLII